MLSNGFAIPIRVKPKTSRYYQVFVLVMHVLALAALWRTSGFAWWLSLMLCIVVVFSFGYFLKTDNANNHIVWTSHTARGWISELDGKLHDWQCKQIIAITNWFVVFNLNDAAGNKKRILWFCDQMDEQSFRRLRVRLRFAQVEATSPGDTI